MKGGRVPNWVWVVLVTGHLLALGWALNKSAWDFPDSGRYRQAAQNLQLRGELYARPWPARVPHGQAVQEFTIRPVGYPLVVLGLGTNGPWPVVLLAVQNVLSLLNIGLVLVCWAQWARPKARSWGVAIAGVLTFPAQFIYANAVMSEMLLQTAVVALVAAGVLFSQNRQKRYFVGVAGATIVALLLKPVFYPLSVGMAGVGMLLAWRQKRVELVLIGLVPLVVVGLYMGWNAQRTGYFHFSSIAEINLLHYNAAGVVRQIQGQQAEERWIAGVLRDANAQPDFATRQQLIQARVGRVLWAHPVLYARQHLQGMITMFLDPGRFDVSQFLGLKSPEGGLLAQARAGGLIQAVGRLPLRLLGLLGVVLLANMARLALAIRGFWQLGSSGPVLRCGRWVAAGLLLYVALLTGPLGAARFLVPVWPLLFGLALVGLQWSKTPEEVISGEGGGANA